MEALKLIQTEYEKIKEMEQLFRAKIDENKKQHTKRLEQWQQENPHVAVWCIWKRLDRDGDDGDFMEKVYTNKKQAKEYEDQIRNPREDIRWYRVMEMKEVEDLSSEELHLIE